MTSQRRRLYFAITLALPVMLLLFVEGGLRFLGFGPDLSLFITETLNGRAYHIMNPAVKHRYFSRVTFQPSTSPDYFLVPKPAGTYRIFCLGGSTTVGFPYWYNASFSSFLRDRLRRTFPERSIEVINLGMTATNSFTALDMTREIMEYEPDLVIVYDGHNEFYGALGVASHESFGGSPWLSRLSLQLVHLRIFQAMRAGYALVGRLFSDDGPVDRGTMMERLARGQTIPYGSPLYEAGREVFRENLSGIRDLCTARNIPVIFGTQVSNLRDMPPFISADPTVLSAQDQLRFHAAHNAGLTAMMNGAFDSALVPLREAAGILPHHAETWFRIGRCLDTLGRRSEARNAYAAARDDDELRFRTGTDFNDIILSMDDGHLAAAVDQEEVFAAHAPDSLIGLGLVLEHLHPSSYGQFLLASGYAAAMRNRGFLASAEEWAQRDTIPLHTLWAGRRVTEVDERLAGRRTEVLITAWPFQEEEGLVSSISETDTLGQLADRATRGQIHWLQLHQGAIEYYTARNDRSALEREYRTIIDQFPMVDVEPYLQLARLLFEDGRYTELEEVFRRSLEVKPTLLALRSLGDIALRTARPAEAVRFYDAMFGFPLSPGEQVENGYLLALAQYRNGRSDLALQRIAAVLRIRPDHLPSVQLMATINGK